MEECKGLRERQEFTFQRGWREYGTEIVANKVTTILYTFDPRIL
jgi:hypothetical protein